MRLSLGNVLIVAHAFPPHVGGVESHIYNIAHHLRRRGYRVRCLVGGEEARQDDDGVEIVRHPSLEVSHLLGARLSLGRHQRNAALERSLEAIIGRSLSEFAPDIIHAHNLVHFGPELAHALHRIGAGTPIVTSVHDRIGEHLFPEVLSVPWAHTLFASDYLRRSLPPCAPSSVLWLGVELQHFTPHGARDPRFCDLARPVIFHPSRLLKWKGVEIGFEAFLILRERLGTGSLVLCASERAATDHQEIRLLRRDIAARAARRGIPEHLVFLEFSIAEMPAAYRASDLVWYPTIDEEPLGLVPLEAMACGVPLVVSDSGGMRETVVANETGLIVAKGDAMALADSAERLLVDGVLRQRLVAAGLERAKLFNNERYVDRLTALFHDLSNRPHQTARCRK